MLRAGPRRATQRALTIIEVLLGLAVLGVLIAVIVPTAQAWLRNAQTRDAAHGVMNGVLLARNEAVRRNRVVAFSLETNGGWTVVCVRCRDGADEIVQQRPGEFDPQRARIDSGGRTTVTFTPGGAPMPTNPADGSLPISKVDVTGPAAGDSVRPLRILVSAAGSVRLCDPDPKLAAEHPRRCVV